ncbi:UPF0559 protein [Dictyostelium discoideum AX4]|uniref:Glucose-induced degradation protein 8 homolog n=1 Tax=Dictyostelium discoideum TaxID=44689 RepID=GID8_DICDI|nr:UPF0559 protein [Dictyostelium discoideum AX4]Q54X16.2 RecName: Full=Glucose-induced degradation protein 8 homolog [Dictyostelium discoideum]EAL67781.2 UPF0559 protein [Dictyostelium discoideum AX4]|eukprot:XP_641761.2 UPF0559 protein [Dictyostelium discoideum AX4]
MSNSYSSNAQKKVISTSEWDDKLAEVNISKSDLNKLVMNYLVIEGYQEAAAKFQEESSTQTTVDLASIADRMAIRSAIQCGDVEKGIEIVNDLNPEILDTNPQLYFHLQQQKLIELIRKGMTAEALKFAQDELAPQGEENNKFLEELEKTISLLVFEDTAKSPLSSLLDHSQRQKTAGELNSAILLSQSQDKDPKLPTILKLLKWAQTQLDSKCIYPKITNTVTGEYE